MVNQNGRWLTIWKNLKYLALLSQVGIVIITPMVGAFFIGQYLVDRIGIHQGFIILLAMIGLFGGLYSAYKLLMKW